MNHKSKLSIFMHRSISFCLLLLLFSQPILVGAGSKPAPSIPAPAKPAAIDVLDFTALYAGSGYTCGIVSGGGVKCWGYNLNGQLGDGTTQNRNMPVDGVGLDSGATAISAGSDHTCAIVSGDGVKCWGYNGYGELGDGTNNSSLTPVSVAGLDQGVTAIAAGLGYTCALLSGGGVKCWGLNDYGRLGDGTIDNRNTPVDVVGLDSGVIAIAAGGLFTCALKTTGGVVCWGVNGYVYDEYGSYYTYRNTPGDVAGLENGVIAIAVGSSHGCAAISGGGVKCWGWNSLGQLGDGTWGDEDYITTPVDVSGLDQEVTAITTHANHTCVLFPSGNVQCWGANGDGQLGDGTTTDRNTPVDVIGLPGGITAISAGESHTCALAPDGSILCWGGDYFGELGDGALMQRNIPVDVAGLEGGAIAIDAGSVHTCVIVSGGAVKCWGYNYLGQLGDGTFEAHKTPVDVAGLGAGVTAISTGMNHTCAIDSAGGAKCWGFNANGELGDGTTDNRNAPVAVVGLDSGVTSISAGTGHTCAIVTGGEVKCWGVSSHTPVGVAGLGNGVKAIAAGMDYNCAIVSSGGVMCWGFNWAGQLGDGTTENRDAPVDVVGLTSGVTAITAGDADTCAIVSGGAAKCWGWNEYGQLGDGTAYNRYTPVDVIGLTSGVTAISTGGEKTCALTADGKARCWGMNQYGDLGDGTTLDRRTPVGVSGMEWNVAAIAPNDGHTCALVSTGRPKCWGTNVLGQLGNGDDNHKVTPVYVVSSTPLTINYTTGRPGSFFTITGWNFPPNAHAALAINGHVITTALIVNPTGSLIFFLDSSPAQAGDYLVTVNITSGSGVSAGSPSANFTLASDAPLRPLEGGGQTFLILNNFLYLPLLSK